MNITKLTDTEVLMSDGVNTPVVIPLQQMVNNLYREQQNLTQVQALIANIQSNLDQVAALGMTLPDQTVQIVPNI